MQAWQLNHMYDYQHEHNHSVPLHAHMPSCAGILLIANTLDMQIHTAMTTDSIIENLCTTLLSQQLVQLLHDHT